MFTVLANTRNSNLYLIAALAIMAVVLLTFAVVPAISAPQPVRVPVTSISEAGSDYYQRHPEWTRDIQSVVIPVTGSLEASDYFQRHPELVLPVEISADTTDYFTRHPELRQPGPAQRTDLSDYFLRH